MAKTLMNHIIEDFVSLDQKVLAIQNNDRFLFREDVIGVLVENEFVVVFGSQLEQRIAFELRDPNKILILLNEQKRDFLPDMKMKIHIYEFEMTKYLNAYHIPTIISLDFPILDELFAADPVTIYSKSETELKIDRIQQKINELKKSSFDLNSVVNTISLEFFNIRTDWQKLISILSNALNKVIGTHQYQELNNLIDQSNVVFQEHLQNSYKTLVNSSSVKSPPIVSRVLDYIEFNYSKEKIALIVVDGFAYWQYLLLKSELNLPTEDHITYSWLPSITQLSRQAIFRGGNPEKNYKQNPANERKLWEHYWKNRGVSSGSILYEYDHYHSTSLTGIERYALVYKDLDTKMHLSTDYMDLKSLTEHWINRSGILEAIHNIKEQGFQIFITSDHGNVEAKGFLSLKGRDKLGTNKSGSRSERHLEYSEEWIADEFLNNNPEVEDEISRERNTLYLKNNKSFSNKKMLVSHGGSHLFEVLVPFIKI